MKLIDNTKYSWGLKIINNKIRKEARTARVCNINDASKIGIIYNASDLVSYGIIKNLFKTLNSKNHEVITLGYINSKDFDSQRLRRNGFDFFTKTQLNWFNKPIGKNITHFIQEPFDILLNLSLDKSYPIDYIVAMSNSKFKVGKFFNDNHYLDLMIEMKKASINTDVLQNEIQINNQTSHHHLEFNQEEEIEVQLNYLIDQLLHYLSMLNPVCVAE